jgi:hypothetical protein
VIASASRLNVQIFTNGGVTPKTKSLLDVAKIFFGVFWDSVDGQGFEEGCGDVHMIYWVGCFSFIFVCY